MEDKEKSEEEKRREQFEHLYNNDNKFNDPIEGDPTRINFNPSIRENLKGIFAFFKKTVSFKDGSDVDGTIKNIRSGINFTGPNVWVLICSIIVASVGLNTNSVAVIIGAMLISPLMGPIRGVGLGVGTNDIKLIFESLKNFGVAVGISLLTAWLYFLISPLTEITPELEGRTGPNLMDVFIAFFGGLAGIIAASRGDNSTVIPGVAIATALMPPLCTAGFGLASGNWPFFFGALYLFFLNTLFICLSTIIVVRYLKFPLRNFINPKVEKKVKVISYVLIFLVIIPAAYLFYGKIQETIFNQSARTFIKEVVEDDPTLRHTQKIIFDDDLSKIELILTNKVVSDATVLRWKSKMDKYGLDSKFLTVIQGEDVDSKLAELKNELSSQTATDSGKGYDIIQEKENELKRIEAELDKTQLELDLKLRSEIDIETLLKNLALNYPEVKAVEVYQGVGASKSIMDTVYAIAVQYTDSLSLTDKKAKNTKIGKQLKIQLEGQDVNSNYRIKVYNF